MHTNYVNDIIVRLYEVLGDNIDDHLAGLYALLVLAKGTDTTLEDVHDAWAIWRNVDRPDHKSLVPFSDLSKEVQELDRKYMNAIHSVLQNMKF
jgi:hypothetical protein